MAWLIVPCIMPEGSVLYTDEGRHYGDIRRDRYAVNRGVGKYARMVDLAAGIEAMATTKNTESAWPMLRRSFTGVYHKMSPKHLKRYIKTIAGRWNTRSLDTEEQMRYVFRSMMNREITFAELTADNGLPSGSCKGGAFLPERRKRYATKWLH